MTRTERYVWRRCSTIPTTRPTGKPTCKVLYSGFPKSNHESRITNRLAIDTLDLLLRLRQPRPRDSARSSRHACGADPRDRLPLRPRERTIRSSLWPGSIPSRKRPAIERALPGEIGGSGGRRTSGGARCLPSRAIPGCVDRWQSEIGASVAGAGGTGE